MLFSVNTPVPVAVNSQPLVTVYIATHNRPQLLARAVSSCMAQTYPALEIIVVDDGSDTENARHNAELLANYPHVKYIRLEHSSGAPVARNTAIMQAQGEFITGLDDDDEFEPQRISDLVQQWSDRADCAFLCTGYTVINQQRRRIKYARRARVITYQQLLYANLVGNQLFTRTASLRAIGGFDVALPSCQDYDTWLRLAAVFGQGYRINSTSYILHQDHSSLRISQSDNREAGYLLLLNKHRQFMSPSQLASQQVNRALYNNSALPWPALLRLPLVQIMRVIKILMLQLAQKLAARMRNITL